jgi:hypothetical protein
MIRPVTILRTGFLPFVFFFACRQTTFQDDNNPEPNDLQIVAQYGAGYSHLMSWRYTITGDGKVDKEIYDADTNQKQTTLSKEDLADILAKFKEAEFHDLRKEYFPAVSDFDTLILAITQNNKTQKVVVYAPALQEEDQEVKRFLRVWSEILRKVPSPNPEQKPELYQP